MTELLSSLILLFPPSYEASKMQFREHCREERAICTQYVLPDQGHNTENLSVDALVYEPKSPATKALVLVSGTHGVEAPAGAAIQRLLIEKYKQAFLDKNYRLILVHAINPWGFAHQRRGTSKNIDLNRNFPADGDDVGMPNSGYAKMAPVLNGEGLSGTDFWQRLRFSLKMFWPLISFQMSFDELNQAVAGGQREFPEGLFYGGQSAEPQVAWLGDFLDHELRSIPEAVVMDLHTGLGDREVLHLMTSDSPDERAQTLRSRLFPTTDNNDQECLKNIPCSQIYKSTSGKTKGFYSVAGDFLDFAEDLGSDSLKIAAFTMEFGTQGTGVMSQLDSLFTMAAENACYQAEKQNLQPWPENEKAIAHKKFLALFNPEDPIWRHQVLEKSARIFERILQTF